MTTIVWKKITEVKLNPDNPRIVKDDKFKKLVKSIQEFPQMLLLRPLVVNKDNVVLGGNMRYRAMQELKYKEIPVVVADNISEEQEREFVIKDNVSFGEWDWDMLANQHNSTELIEWGLDVVDENNDTNDEGDEKLSERKIEITIQEGDYSDAVALINYWEKKDAYVGGMFVNYLRDEKRKFKAVMEKDNHA